MYYCTPVLYFDIEYTSIFHMSPWAVQLHIQLWVYVLDLHYVNLYCWSLNTGHMTCCPMCNICANIQIYNCPAMWISYSKGTYLFHYSPHWHFTTMLHFCKIVQNFNLNPWSFGMVISIMDIVSVNLVQIGIFCVDNYVQTCCVS